MQVTEEFDDFYAKLSSTKQKEIIEHIINEYTDILSLSMEGINAGKLVKLAEGINAGSTAKLGSTTSNKCRLCGRS